MICRTLESAHEAVIQLVHDFAANEAHFLSSGYSEAQVRLSFIDKLWCALGWDVCHEEQKNPYAQEVKVEDPQKIGGSARRADYAFHTAPNFRDARFFCEAKKPHVQLKTDADAAFQTIRYGWSAGTPLAVLTDFEQLHIMDCRAKPDIDTALSQSLLFFHYKDWLNQAKFAELYYIFSREAFSSGAFEDYVSKLPRPKKVGAQPDRPRIGIQPADTAFLIDLERYRETLAKLLKAADNTLDGDTLTELVQRIVDRLVFLRFLEDKLIETEIQVSHFSRSAGGHSWSKFLAASRKLDQRYNGLVYKYHPILDNAARLPIDEARFADICEELSHTRSSYDFNHIPIHILGSIYERFLGKVIVTTDTDARVEERPEVRKAGGVYYTPEYIVRYICEQTVGRLIAGKTPAQIAKMRFADIACGSGSFLLGIYDLLLRHHGLWYNENPTAAKAENLAPPEKGNKRLKSFIAAVVESDGVLRLTLDKKREILVSNVFGVDLDPQAVEVAHLSLYLKLLEEETTATARQHYLDLHEALLPSLSGNVKNFNSLIGGDILFGQFEFSANEERKLRPMDFESAFPKVFSIANKNDVGFDAIVGNPPWGADPGPQQLAYSRALHREIIVRMIDSFMFFVHRAASKLRPVGRLGMIVPDVLLYQTDNAKLRGFLLEKFQLTSIANMGDVFEQVTRPAAIFTGYKSTERNLPTLAADLSRIDKLEKTRRLADPETFLPVSQKLFAALPGRLFVTQGIERYAIWKAVHRLPFTTLSGVTDNDGIQRGVSPDLKDAFLVSSDVAVLKKLEVEKLRPVLTGGHHVRRYLIKQPDLKLIYTTRDDKFTQIPNICKFISEFRKQITCKEVLQEKHPLYALHRPREESIFLKPQKLLGVITQDRLTIASDSSELFATDGLYLFSVKAPTDFRYVMGLLNSALFVFLYRLLAVEDGRVLAQVKPTTIGQLPIRTLNLSKPKEKRDYDRMTQLVEAMLSTQQHLTSATNETDRSYYENKAAGLDRQIDELTCEIYGLTSEERALVDG